MLLLIIIYQLLAFALISKAIVFWLMCHCALIAMLALTLLVLLVICGFTRS